MVFENYLHFIMQDCNFKSILFRWIALDMMPADITGIERLQKTLGKVGASVAMTTITDVVAFAVSSFSTFPAVRYFCFYAMSSILFVYILMVTVLVAYLSFEIKRIENGKWDVISCKKKKDYIPWTKSSSSIAHKVFIHYLP